MTGFNQVCYLLDVLGRRVTWVEERGHIPDRVVRSPGRRAEVLNATQIRRMTQTQQMDRGHLFDQTGRT